MTIVYGSGAPGATAPTAAGSTAWPAKSKASVAGVLTSLARRRTSRSLPPPASAVAFPTSATLWSDPGMLVVRVPASAAPRPTIPEPACRRSSCDPPGPGTTGTEAASRARHARFVPRAVPGPGRPRSRRRASPPTALTPSRRARVDNLNGVETPSSRRSPSTGRRRRFFSDQSGGGVGSSALVSPTAVDTGGSGIAQLTFRFCAGGGCAFGAGTAIGSPSPPDSAPSRGTSRV